MSFSKLSLLMGAVLMSVALLPRAQGQGPSVATTPEAAGEAKAQAAPESPAAATTLDEIRAKAQAANDALPYDYRIGAGDTLAISVWKEPEASANVIVRPDGKISLALLKEVLVAGLTPVEAQQLIADRLTKLITEPDVTVIVTGIHSLKIYVVGAVKSVSTIPYTYRMTVMQAISEAGGLTDYAKKKDIYVLRMENGKEKKLPFDYSRALKGEAGSNNFMLLPGDTLVVPD